jgi:acyl-coenzyme A thioesterase PaaI-like protein
MRRIQRGDDGVQYGGRVASAHAGGGFNPPEPTAKGGPDYGRFIDAVRALQDHARAADAPDEVVTEAADLLEKVSALLAPFDTDEWSSPSGRRLDLPNRGGILAVPMRLKPTGDGRISGWARFARFHLGRNGAAHGGAIGLLFDSVLGFSTAVLTGQRAQRTAFLHIDYRAIVPIEKTLQVDAELTGIEGRKIFACAALADGDTVLAEAHALFVKLKPGQP